MDYKKIPYYGLFAALAILMGYVEMMIPVPIPIPGVKLGLANVIIIIMMYFMDTKSAFFISIVRVLLSGLLFAGLAGLLYSLSGALCSFLAMALLKKTERFSIIGVSLSGGVFHNVGQIIVAMLVLETTQLVYYLPALMVAGTVTGFFVGLLGTMITERIKKGINV